MNLTLIIITSGENTPLDVTILFGMMILLLNRPYSSFTDMRFIMADYYSECACLIEADRTQTTILFEAIYDFFKPDDNFIQKIISCDKTNDHFRNGDYCTSLCAKPSRQNCR